MHLPQRKQRRASGDPGALAQHRERFRRGLAQVELRAAEADAVRLIDRREVDCVIVVGAATTEVAAALARAADEVVVVRLPDDEVIVRGLAARVAAGAPA